MSDTASKPSITIKKYANRRLYNTATSSYVTLEDLSLMVKEGTDFTVYDAKTSEDITRSVLTQIIVEEESKSGQQSLLPIGFLRQLISFYGDNLQWMVPKYLEQSMDSLTGNHGRIQEYFQSSLGNIFPFGTTLEEMSKQNMAMFERAINMFSLFPMGMTSMGTTTQDATALKKDMMETSTKMMTSSTPAQNLSQTVKQERTATFTPVADCPTTETNIATANTTKTEDLKAASITNLKPRNENPIPKVTPMPNVQAAAANSGADDMQQKIANLQRQLADLAKSRA